MSHNSNETRQRRQNLGGTNAASPYFTSVGGNSNMPPPPPPAPRPNYQQFSGSGSSYGSGSGGGGYYPPPSPGAYSASPSPTPQQQQQHSSEVKINRNNNKKTQAGGCSGFAVFMLLLVWTGALAGAGYYYYTEEIVHQFETEKRRAAQRHELELEQLSAEKDRQAQKDYARRVQEAMAEVDTKHKFEVDQLKRLGQKKDLAAHTARKELEHVQVQLRELEHEIATKDHGIGTATLMMQQRIQDQSKRWVLERYGAGPHKVEFEIRFPNEENSWFVILELAPLDLMPHTIHLFLEQMERGLYNQAKVSFHHNAPHMILAEPVPNHFTPHELWHDAEGQPNENALWDAFERSGYNQVLFQEYSPDYPHDLFTLGLSRKNGADDPHSGPGFYINMHNNPSHGPGGYATDGTGDPCFAKVVNGKDVIERIHAASGPLADGDWKAMEQGNIALMSVAYIHPQPQ